MREKNKNITRENLTLTFVMQIYLMPNQKIWFILFMKSGPSSSAPWAHATSARSFAKDFHQQRRRDEGTSIGPSLPSFLFKKKVNKCY